VSEGQGQGSDLESCELEAQVIIPVQEYDLTCLGGYRVKIVDGKLYLEKLPAPNLNQLKLFEENQPRASR